MKRVHVTLSPRECAISSPKDNTFICFENMKDTIIPIIIPMAGSAIDLNVMPDSVAIINVVILIVLSVSRSFIVLIPAERNDDTVMPASMIVVLELSPMLARKNIISVVNNAPANANKGE